MGFYRVAERRKSRRELRRGDGMSVIATWGDGVWTVNRAFHVGIY